MSSYLIPRPSTCNDKDFDRIISVLYINGDKVRTSYYSQTDAEYTYGEIEIGDRAKVLNLYNYK